MSDRDDVVAIDLGEGIEVIGEWSRTHDRRAVVLALHDRERDLDTVRPFARQFARLGIDTLMLDLPGHGLSSGDWDQQGAHAVVRALAVCAADNSRVSVLTMGAAAGLVLAQSAEVSSLVAIAPKVDTSVLAAESPWRMTPLLTASDPSNDTTESAQKAIAAWSRAWHVQLHGAFEQDGDTMRGVWKSQLTTAAAAFAAEQFAHASTEFRPHSARQGDRPDGK